MKARLYFGLILLLTGAGCAAQTATQTKEAVSPSQKAAPGETVRVVRFNVKPGQRSEFEDFFWNSLKPAARKLNPDSPDLTGGFRLLIPKSINRNGFYTYYVLVDPVRGKQSSGQAMRDMVRTAFPGEDGESRVRRWMSSIALGDHAPVGENFVEADLEAESPPLQDLLQ